MHHRSSGQGVGTRWRLGLLLALSVMATSGAGAESMFRAGAAAVDITPHEFPLNMPGGFSANHAHSAHDPLHSRAIVMDDGKHSVAIAVVDNLGVAPEVIEQACQVAMEKTGIPLERMLVSATHTHSAPASNSSRTDGPEAAYHRHFVAGIADSIIQAYASLQPARAGGAFQPLPEEVFNRRWHLKPGKMPTNPFGELDQVKMNPGTNPAVLDRPAGPVDPDITILSLQNHRGRPLALLANYSLHYVGGTPRGQVSADYFGEFARLMPARLRASEDFVAIMSNGTSGDINNIPFLVDRAPREPFEQIRIVASKAADAAWVAHRKIDAHRSDVQLDSRHRKIELRYRRPTDAQVLAAKAVLAIEDPGQIERLPRLAQHYARNVVRFAERKEETLEIHLQTFQVGDLAICAIPFETFAEIGLELKDRSPYPDTMVIGLAGGRHGYLPTPEQHRLGGYETFGYATGVSHIRRGV